VDAAENTFAWARRNASLSGLAEAPIRWIVDDALKFARRELKRGRRYDAVILDPPSYGHGPRGETWKLAEHLPELLALCTNLTGADARFMLLTCHSPGSGPREIKQFLIEALGRDSASHIDAEELAIECADGRRLHAGVVARYADDRST
jgi:23S rRNA (cytosine1962-C5)-methyltransferase